MWPPADGEEPRPCDFPLRPSKNAFGRLRRGSCRAAFLLCKGGAKLAVCPLPRPRRMKFYAELTDPARLCC